MELVDTTIRRRINIARLQEKNCARKRFRKAKIQDIDYGSHERKNIKMG